MKKIVSILLLITFVVSMMSVFSVSASAAGSGGGGGGSFTDNDLLYTAWTPLWNYSDFPVSGFGKPEFSRFVISPSDFTSANSYDVLFDTPLLSTLSNTDYVSSLKFHNLAMGRSSGGKASLCTINSATNEAGGLYIESGHVLYFGGGTDLNNSTLISYIKSNFLYNGFYGPSTSHTLTFDPGTGTFPASVPTTDGKVIIPDIEAGTKINQYVPAQPSYSGFGTQYFLGWYSPDGQVLGVNTEMPNADIVYTARYSPPYTVSFNANGGNPSTIPSLSIPPGSRLPSNPPAVSREGYAFDGWYNSFGVKYENIPLGLVTGDTTFTARWSQDSGYTISFVSNKEGYTAPASVTGVTKVPVEWLNNGYPLPTFEPPYLSLNEAGWLGWTTADGSAPPLAGSTLTGNLVLYGQWAGTNYTLTFGIVEGQEEIGNAPAPVYVDKIPDNLPDVIPEDDNYTFVGWYWNADGTGNLVVRGTPIGSDVTIYAKFALKNPGTTDKVGLPIVTAFFDLFETVIDVTIFAADNLFGSDLEIYGVPVLTFVTLGAVASIIISKGDDD